MKITEIADHTGFSAATLRYYEQIGLMPAAPRTHAGYRTYDDRDVERLAFIGRAKQLGCTLEEIADLLTAWDGDCADVQGRLRQLVAEKRMSAQRQIAELVGFGAQLEQAAAALEVAPHDGACGDGCACVAEASEPAIACTLPTESLGGRLDEWRLMLEHVQERTEIAGGVRLSLAPDAPVDTIARLARAEQDCCSFFSFALTLDDRGNALEVRAPEEAFEMLEAAFGATG